jgi:hypothetical protein
MEARAEFEQARDATAHREPARGGEGGARQDLEQRRLAGAVRSDQSDALTGFDLEVDVVQRVHCLVPRPFVPRQLLE